MKLDNTGTNGNYSQWNGVSTGDFYMFNLNNGLINSLCKESFPINWDLGVISKIRFQGNNYDNLISLRNYDGNMFIYNITDLPMRRSIIEDNTTLKTQSNMMTSNIQSNNIYENSFSIFPNPINKYATVKYSIAESSVVSLLLYNIRGEKVKTISNTKTEAGDYSLNIEFNDIEPGVYFLQMCSDKYNKSLKIVLIN